MTSEASPNMQIHSTLQANTVTLVVVVVLTLLRGAVVVCVQFSHLTLNFRKFLFSSVLCYFVLLLVRFCTVE